MRIGAIILIIVLVGGAGCFNNGQNHVEKRESNADRVEKKKQREELDQAETMNRKELADVAEAFLRKEGLKWGPPIDIIHQDEYSRYLLLYSTPKSERGVGGPRGVFISVNDNKPVRVIRVSLVPQL